MKRFINNEVLKLTKDIRFIAKDIAPNDESGLFSAPSLVVWTGASDSTIFEDKLVNWSFRAFHDVAHLKTGLLFNPAHEIELGRIQASRMTSDLMRELIYCEVSLQAAHYLKTGQFVMNQREFTLNYLKLKGLVK